ncbi:MAG: hypothetical protein AAF840_05915, partial [Bacteroidota bacterium]
SLGIVYEYRRVQVGAFAGLDLINNNKSRGERLGFDWKYQNAVWFSIGFGYSIISRPTKSSGRN